EHAAGGVESVAREREVAWRARAVHGGLVGDAGGPALVVHEHHLLGAGRRGQWRSSRGRPDRWGHAPRRRGSQRWGGTARRTASPTGLAPRPRPRGVCRRRRTEDGART